MYLIIYDYKDKCNIRETFHGSWFELQDYIQQMLENGCYNIEAVSLEE